MTKRILNIILTVLLLAIAFATGFLWQKEKVPATTAADNPVIVVDAGHGGKDPGKVGLNNVLEKDINLQIAFKLRECLESNGITVVMTRDEDVGLYSESDSNKKSADMRNRVGLIKNANADMVLSIHQNSFTDSSVNGAQVFYYGESEYGEKLALSIQNKLTMIEGTNKRPVKENNDYYMLLNTPCPAVIIECGFLSNEREEALLCDEEYQGKLAEAICAGALDFLSSND